MNRRNRTWRLPSLAATVALLGLATCTVVFVGDLQVTWTLDSATSAAACTTYGVDKWEVEVSGPIRPDIFAFACGDHWDSGTAFYGVDEGRYTVIVRALGTDGGAIATQSKDILLPGGTPIWTADFDFTAADFTGGGDVCGDGTCGSSETATSCPQDCSVAVDYKLLLSWKINGTVDGTATGTSWDTCAEVGAAWVAIDVDGTVTEVACEGDDANKPNMMAVLGGLTAGQHTVRMELLDASKTALTTKTLEADGKITAVESPTEEAFEFLFDSFFEPQKTETTGTYLFETLYEGLQCSATVPAVGQRVVLLRLDGTPLASADVCYAGGSSCVKTNGADFGACLDSQEQNIAGIKWGAYKIKLQGVPAGKTTICWESKQGGSNEIDIMVGAGTTNPVVRHDLTRIDTAGDCAP